MPKKIRPRYDVDPLQKVQPYSFTETQTTRLAGVLGSAKGNIGEIIAQLESCAADYLRIRNQYQQKPSRAEQNAALNEIGQLASVHGSALHDLEMKLRTLDMDTEWELMRALPRFNALDFADALANVTDDLANLADAANQALDAGKMKSGPRTPTWIQRTVVRLANLYETSTGKRFSHNPKAKTQYVGEPRSAAGQFIVAFFQIVDSKVRQTSISTAMTSFVKFRRS
jgi:hypothetical protein